VGAAAALQSCGLSGNDQPGPAPRPVAANEIIVSPSRDTPDASPATQVSFLGAPISSLGHVTVVGSQSGPHAGKVLPYSTADGGSFVPELPFASGERVDVRVEPKLHGLSGALSFSFEIARPAPPPPRPGGGPVPPHLPQQTFRSLPELHPPPISITTDHRRSAAGEVFLAPLTNRPGGGHIPQRGPMILDPRGRLEWFLPTSGQLAAENLSVQRYQGAHVLTWWQGVINPLGFGQGEDVIADSSYREIARLRGANGYAPDLHEFLITPQGTAWYTVFAPVQADLRAIHGRQNGSLLDSIVQEVDIKTGLVMYEWHSMGHISIKDSYARLMSSPRYAYDFSHLNTIEPHHDTLVLSARNTWCVYEVDMHTGQIRWRLGGKHSTFGLGPGVRFAWQHDAQLHPDGTLSLFDNEAAPVIQPVSRALLLKLDSQHMTATVVRQYTHPQKLIAGTQGSVQMLHGGAMFVGWGSDPYFSEISASGQLTFDGHFSRPIQSYRAYYLRWKGQPVTRPAVAAQAAGSGMVDVYASWNGATEVARWQVLAGPSASSLSPVGAASWNGLETQIRVRTGQRFIAVQALDSSGRVLATSAPVNPGISR
jgi:hypothetical protein